MTVYVPLPGSQKRLLPKSQVWAGREPIGIGQPDGTCSARLETPRRLRSALHWSRRQSHSRSARPRTHEQPPEQHGASQEDLDKVESFRRSSTTCSW